MKLLVKYVLALTLVLGSNIIASAEPHTNLEGNAQIDALIKLLTTLKNDTIKVKTLSDIAYAYNKISPYEGIRYANQSIALAEKLHWDFGIARGNSCLGANYFSLSDFSKAYKYWLIALEINEKIGNGIGVANHLHNIGNVFFSQKKYNVALEYYERGLSSSITIGNTKIIGNSYTSIANVYAALKDYKKALEYNLKALEIDEKLGMKGDIAADKINIGSIYNAEGNYDEALKVLFYGKDIKKGLGDKNGLANAYSMIGTVYFNLAKDSLKTISNSTERNKNLHLSKAYLDSAIATDKEIGYLDNMQKSYKCLSDVQLMLGDYKNAFYSYTLYSKINDSIFSIDKQSEIFNLMTKEEIEEKDRAAEKASEEKERIEYLEMGGVCLFIVSLVIILIVIREKQINPEIIDVLCTFSVLIFFEFINLLIHARIEALTDHNLILTLLCLLVIASIIIPIHHKLEHWVKKKVKVTEDHH